MLRQYWLISKYRNGIHTSGLSRGSPATARTRRRWSPEEKKAVTKEVQEDGSVAEMCRKYSIDTAMYYRWKESYDSFGWDGLNAYATGGWGHA